MLLKKEIIIGGAVFATMSVIGYSVAHSQGSDLGDGYYYDGKDVFVTDDNDVYLVGSKCRGTSETDRPILWINGKEQEIGPVGNFNSATSVFVDGEDVYVTMNLTDEAFLWKNGDMIKLGNNEANSVFVSNSKVYVAGQDGGQPVLWIDNEPHYLSDTYGTATSVYVNGDDVYVAGISDCSDFYSYSGIPTLWKNGESISLSDEMGRANCVVVANDTVYVAGETNSHGAVLWENGETVVLSCGSSAYSVAANGSNVYAVGVLYCGYWKNGKQEDKTQGMRDVVESVKIKNGKVYFGLQSVKNYPLDVIYE